MHSLRCRLGPALLAAVVSLFLAGPLAAVGLDPRTEHARMVAKYKAIAAPRDVDLWKADSSGQLAEHIPPSPEAAVTLELWARIDNDTAAKLRHPVLLAEDVTGLLRLWLWPARTTGQDTIAQSIALVDRVDLTRPFVEQGQSLPFGQSGPPPLALVAEGPGLGWITARAQFSPATWHHIALVYDLDRWSFEGSSGGVEPGAEAYGDAAEAEARSLGATDSQEAAARKAAMDRARVLLGPSGQPARTEILRAAGLDPKRRWPHWPRRQPWVYMDGRPAAGRVPEELTKPLGPSALAINSRVSVEPGQLALTMTTGNAPTTAYWQSYRACAEAHVRKPWPPPPPAGPLEFVEYHRRTASESERWMGTAPGDCLALGSIPVAIEIRFPRSTPSARTGAQIQATMGRPESGLAPIDESAERAALGELAWLPDLTRVPRSVLQLAPRGGSQKPSDVGGLIAPDGR